MNNQFTEPLLQWYTQFGRKDLPWQWPRSAYRVWISEIMLQQTQVKTVIPYFNRFMQRFPTVQALAQASLDEVLAYWSGLGYYSRARYLYQTAQIIVTQYGRQFPTQLEQWHALPGIGASTAAAICSLAFNQPTAILDGNVKRVLARYFLIEGVVSQAAVNHRLWELAHQCMPAVRCADYTQALMDLGALRCTAKNPICTDCPLQNTCLAKQHGLVLQLPQRKPTRQLLIKHQQFLVIQRVDRRIFLERRPDTGIWGGLWCLPQLDMDQSIHGYLQQQFGFQLLSVCPMMVMKHTFTHFHLHLHVMQCTIDESALLGNSWYAHDDLPALGLAKPIRKILYCALAV